MSLGQIAAGRGRAVRVVIALTVVPPCLAAVAFAATRPERAAEGLGSSQAVGVATQGEADAPRAAGKEPLWRPRLVEFPEATSTASEVQFRFHVPPRAQRPPPPTPGPSGAPRPPRPFQCRLDDGGWKTCSSPDRLVDLAVGDHVFAVRAFNRDGRFGPAVSYAWRREAPPSRPEQVDPKPFAIEAQGQPEDLYPGDPPQPLSILVANPNSVPIKITGLTVAVAGDLPECSPENFAVTPSNVSPTAPLAVPANGSVTLPTATVSAPTIGMLNLPVNQDACRGAEVPLAFDGEAHG